jgi:two-component system, OmpR family, sensor histidine kinase MtrB
VSSASASLRTVIATAVTAVGALSLVTATALVLLTRELRRSHEELRIVAGSVRQAEEAAIALLLHARLDDVLARREVEQELRRKLERAGELARSELDRDVLRVATAKVEAYLAPPDDPGPRASLEEAFAAVETLMATSIRRSEEADARARRLDHLGNVIGIGTAAVLVATAGWLLWWLRSRTLEPLRALADAMTRFGSGDLAARAPGTGPAELRAIARRFNQMAAALAAHRERQMTLIAGVAHELRNPLSALKLATHAASSREADGGERKLDLVRRQVHRLERMVSDLLEVGRIEAGRLEVRRAPVDLRPIVESVVSLFGATSAAHRLTALVPDEQVVAPCDPGRIEQVLNNLVSNALKYSPEGGEVRVVVEPRSDAISLSVADEGAGIDGAELETIFEPFRRGRALHGEVPGVGLGLYISRRIVEAHGGQLRVRSSPGHGSTFEVVLPR